MRVQGRTRKRFYERNVRTRVLDDANCEGSTY